MSGRTTRRRPIIPRARSLVASRPAPIPAALSACALLLGLALTSSLVRAQAPAPETEAELADRLRSIRELLGQQAGVDAPQGWDEVARECLRLERALRLRREREPSSRPLISSGVGRAQSVSLALAELVAGLPEAVRDRVRRTLDSLRNQRFDEALARGDLSAAQRALEGVPGANPSPQRSQRLAERLLERGDLAPATALLERRLADLLQRAARDPTARSEAQRLAGLRLRLVALAGRPGDAEQALLTLRALGQGAGDSLGPALLELARRLSKTPLAAPPPEWRPGGARPELALPRPLTLSDPLASALAEPPLYQLPLLDRTRELVFVADGRGLLALDLGRDRREPLRWSYRDPEQLAPDRLEALPYRPALAEGRVLATLRAANRWSVVALAADDGGLAWRSRPGQETSGDAVGFPDWSRASWVSSPLACPQEQAVYVSVVEREGLGLRCLLVRLSLETGRTEWVAELARKSGGDYLQLAAPPPPPARADNGDLVVLTGLGLVARVSPADGEPRWTTRYPDVPGDRSTVIVSRRRFRPQSPLLDGPTWIAAPVDSSEVLALDPDSGQLIWSAPRDASRYCAAGPGGQVLLLGRRLRMLDRDDGRLTVAGPELGEQILAPPLVLGQEILAVTATRLLRLGLADGALRGQLRVERAGVPVWLGRGEVGLLSRSSLQPYEDLASRRRRTAEQALALGRLHAERNELPQAREQLLVAAQSGTPSALEARRAGWELFARVARAAQSRGDSAAYLRAAEQALRFAWGRFVGLLSAAPSLAPAEQELTYPSADLAAAYAEALVEAAGSSPGSASLLLLQRAADALTCLTAVPAGARLRTPFEGVEVDAQAYAEGRLRQLLRRHGRACYVEQERAAAAALRLARQSRRPLQTLVDRYPVSRAAAEGLWRLADLARRNRLVVHEITHLERLWQAFPSHPRGPQALARLADTYSRTGRPGAATRCLRALLELDPEPRIEDRAASAWAAPLSRRLLRRPPGEIFAQEASEGLSTPLRLLLSGASQLDAPSPGLAVSEAPWQGPADLVTLRRGDVLSLRRSPTGERLLEVPGVPPELARRRPAWSEGLLIVPFRDRVAAWDPAGVSTQPRWVRRLPALPAPERRGRTPLLGPDPLHALAVTRDAVLTLSGTNVLRVFDASSGRRRWALRLPRPAKAGLILGPGLVLAPALDERRLDTYALEDGRALGDTWRLPRELTRREWTGVAWPTGGPLCVFAGDTVFALDPERRRSRWTQRIEGFFPERPQLVGGDTLILDLKGKGAAGLIALDPRNGHELWRDLGSGPRRDGLPPRHTASAGPRALIDRRVAGRDALYTLRRSGGGRDAEVWAQDPRLGRVRWTWALPKGHPPSFEILETPSHLLLPRTTPDRTRVVVTALARGTGRLAQTIRLPGRELTGSGAALRQGALVVTTDRGHFVLGTRDGRALAAAAAAAGARLAERPRDPRLRDRLAARLAHEGRPAEALEVCERGLLREGLDGAAYARLFERLEALSELATDQQRPTASVGRLSEAPAIDGELNDRYRPWSTLQLDRPRVIRALGPLGPLRPAARWRGEDDLSARLHLGWSETHLYLAVDVFDRDFVPFDTEAETWTGDGLLIALDPLDDGGTGGRPDDMLLSLALSLPRQNAPAGRGGQEPEERSNTSFVRAKDDGSGVIYETAIPWTTFIRQGVVIPPGGPRAGFSFGLNVVVLDDDGERDGSGERIGTRQTLSLTPGTLLARERERWPLGFRPGRFARITLR